jgi:8-oxo-dGTP pyrophosphatase MutT (NUDIX family)
VTERVEYFHDPKAPRPDSSVPSPFAVVRDEAGQVLLSRRLNSGDREIPGGKVEGGESVVDAVNREVEEETGVLITVIGVSGIYTDPGCVIAYPTGGLDACPQ